MIDHQKRAAFEAWREGDELGAVTTWNERFRCYNEANAQREWVLWQAACASQSAQEKEPHKLLGWRTDNYLWETDDIETARNWEPHVGVLPIFEGDPNTALGQAQETPHEP